MDLFTPSINMFFVNPITSVIKLRLKCTELVDQGCLKLKTNSIEMFVV